MAVAIRGSIGTVTTGTTSVHPAFSAATAAGNLLVAWVAKEGANAVTCNDGTWIKAVSQAVSSTDVEIWFKPNCGATETSPTFSSTSATFMAAAFAEFTGASKSTLADQTRGSTVTTATSNVAAAASADANAGELLLSAELWFLSMAGTKTTSDTYNNGATPTGNLSNDATSTTSHYRFAYGITTGKASPTQNTAGTTSSASQTNGSAVIATFLLPIAVITPTANINCSGSLSGSVAKLANITGAINAASTVSAAITKPPKNVTPTTNISASCSVSGTVARAPAFPTTPVLDNFNAVEAPVSHGGDWVSASPPNPASDGAKVTGSTGVVAMWNHSFARPIENYITILAVSGFTYTLFTGMSTAAATGNGYKASYAGSNTLTLSRIDSGTPTTLLSLSVTFAQNDVVGLLLETGGKLTAYKNGVPIGSVTDTTYSGAGYTGFAQNNDMDNYGGGTSVVTKPIVPATINGTSTLSGGVIKAPKNITPATSIAATSTVAASVAAQKLVKGGNINAVSSLSGRVSKLARVGGAILANSTLGGIVAALKLIKPATINCVSATTGILSKLLIKFIAERGLTETTDTVSSTLAITVNANCTAGNTIFAIVGARIASSTTSWSAADSRGNTWHLDVLKWDTNRGVAILSTKQDVGTLQSGDVVTITFDVVPTGARMGALEEFAGLISSPLDKTATDSSPTLVTSGDTGATATISKVPELAITALITLYNAADTYAHNQSGTVGTYIAFPSDPMIENDSSAKVTMYAYQIIQSVAAQEEFMSFTPNGSGFAAVIATYKGIVVKLIVPATINALGAVSVTSLTALRAIRSASVSAVSTVSANVTANKLVKGGNIAATSTMSGSVAKQFLLKPANINAVSTVAASVKALRAIRSGAINAVSSLSITRLSALRAILPAQINCLLSASGSVAKKFLLLPATINAVSSASGRVNKLARISGAINAVLTVSGTVAKLTKITGAINCVSTLSANIRALRVVRPAQINCLLTVSGSVGKIFKLPTVSINCTSTLSGNISGKHAIVTSQINCLMTVTGDLVRPKRQISGAINCLMTVGGYVSRVFKLPTATVTCTSTLSGRTNKLASISGAINCAMTTSGSVRALKLIKPSQINAVSTLSGALHMQRGILPSQITCTSTLSGRIVRQIRLVPATINCATTVSAFINTAGHKPLTGGAINCASTLSGNLRVLRAVRSANVTCTSSLAANVTALRRVGGAVINCNTTVSGHVVMQRVLVAAQINSHTVVIATIIVKRGIVGGVITGQSTVSVRLSRLIFVVPGVILCTTLVFGSVGRRSQFSEIITGRVVTNIPLGKTSESSIGNIGTPSIPLGRVSTNSRGRVSSGRPGRAS